MKVNRKDFEKIINKADLDIREKNITNMEKFVYWHERSESYSNAMTKYAESKDLEKHNENFHQSMICELEKNRYHKISKKDLILLIQLLKQHNKKNPERTLFCDNKGRRVKRYDRRAIRLNADGQTIN